MDLYVLALRTEPDDPHPWLEQLPARSWMTVGLWTFQEPPVSENAQDDHRQPWLRAFSRPLPRRALMHLSDEIYHYGRFYARSEKHLTAALNIACGKGNWFKTKVMIDKYGSPTAAATKPISEAPKFGDAKEDNHGWGFSTQAYRGVVFRTKEAAALARTMIASAENAHPDDLVVARSYHEVQITDPARIYGFGPTGMPWEDNKEAEKLQLAARARHFAYEPGDF